MQQGRSAARGAKDSAQGAARDAKPWVERLGRAGFAAVGVVYALIGVLAAQAAIGAGGATTDPEGALGRIVRAPFGRFLLAAVTVGLIGYALWRFVQAALDTENKGTEAKGIGARTLYAGIGLVYTSLALSAARLALGSGGGGGSSPRDWTARLMSQPFGRWLVALVGLGIVAAGLQQFSKAYKAKFREKLNLGQMSATQQQWATRAGRIGFSARGVTFGIIGAFLVIAALREQPRQARGLGGALAALADRPFGPWLLGIVALGLIAYGLFMLVQARYRRMVIT